MNPSHFPFSLALVVLAGLSLPLASATAQPCGTFAQVATPNPGTTSNSLVSMAAASDGTAWAIGSRSGPTTLPLILQFDGSDWSEYPLPSEVEGVAFSSTGSTPEGDVWLAGTRAFSVYERELFFLRARGGVIDRIDQAFSAGAPVDISATSNSDVWALTAAGTVFHFDGSAWTESDVAQLFLLHNYAKGIYAAGPDDVWIVGYGGDGRGIYQGYVLHWDGSSWSSVPTPFEGIRQIYFLDIDGSATDNVWIVGNINNSQHLSLQWDGTGWFSQAGPASDAPLSKVAVLAPNDAWATPYSLTAGDAFFHWDGNTWEEAPVFEIPGASTIAWRELAKVGTCDVWAAGSYYAAPSHQTLTARLSSGPDPGGVACFVGDVTVAKLKVTNRTFQGQARVTVVDADQSLAAGAEVTGHFSGPTNETLTATTDINGEVIFSSAVVGRTKLAWCFTVDHVAALDASYDSALNVETADCAPRSGGGKPAPIEVAVSPTPFNPLTTFSFELPEGEFVSLVVYDLAGRRADTLANRFMPAGNHTVTWNASRLASGVYVYRLESGGEVVSGRVTLVK